MENKLKLRILNKKINKTKKKIYKLNKKEEELIYKKNMIKNYIDIEEMKERNK